MAYNPKKQAQRIIWAMKKKAQKVRTASDKKRYIENQAKKMDRNPTGCEKVFCDLLTELKITFETQKIVQGKIFDFFIPDLNTLIEVDGDYWHGHNVSLTEMNHIQKKTYYNDRRKDTIAKGLGYNLIRVWEHELDDEHYNETKEKIRKMLR
jgi:very-short-patch-repair endonuclease